MKDIFQHKKIWISIFSSQVDKKYKKWIEFRNGFVAFIEVKKTFLFFILNMLYRISLELLKLIEVLSLLSLWNIILLWFVLSHKNTKIQLFQSVTLKSLKFAKTSHYLNLQIFDLNYNILSITLKNVVFVNLLKSLLLNIETSYTWSNDLVSMKCSNRK